MMPFHPFEQVPKHSAAQSLKNVRHCRPKDSVVLMEACLMFSQCWYCLLTADLRKNDKTDFKATKIHPHVVISHNLRLASKSFYEDKQSNLLSVYVDSQISLLLQVNALHDEK